MATEIMPSGPRVKIALDAHYEIESLAGELLKAANNPDDPALSMHIVKAIAVRLRDLSTVVTCSLGDEAEDLRVMRAMLNGAPEHDWPRGEESGEEQAEVIHHG